MTAVDELKAQREKAEENLVLQSEVMEKVEQRYNKLNGNGKKGVLARVLQRNSAG